MRQPNCRLRRRTVLAVLLVLASFAGAQYLLPRSSANSGGAPVTGTGYILDCSVGQPVQGTGAATGLLGYWGFWITDVYDTTHGWTGKARMPLLPSGKELKEGAWLAYDAGGGLIYAAKGNKRPDFYAYFRTGDSWRTMSAWPLGVEAKSPAKGAAACSDGNGVLYATKGNNTRGFWAYYANGDSWRQKRDVPPGLTNKKVKGGTDMAYVEKGGLKLVYLLKGYKNEFWRYHVTGDSWHALANAPVGVNLKWDKGSWLAYDDGNKMIYAHKAKYHEFWKYDVAGDSWKGKALVPMPIPGPAGSKKAKDGSAGAFLGGKIYAFKGGNTQEFWRYDIAGDSWSVRETIPSLAPGSIKKKKVKGGGDLVAVQGALYAIKGNKCNEFWKYSTGTLFEPPPPTREGVMAGQAAIGEWRTAISPNPVVSGFATLRYSLPKAGPMRLLVFDVAGRSVLSQSLLAGRKGAVSLDLRHLSAGVYLVRTTTDDFSATQKLVVQR
jgi:hypothetical protein